MILKKAISSFILTTLWFAGFGQEMLMDLTGNRALKDYDAYLRSEQTNARALGDTLDLPFFDDFSEPFSRLRTNADLWPNPDRWIGNTVYINNHMAVNPISQGVATFDGLDERGRAYGFGTSLPTLSDSLTSKPLNLATAADTVYLSFYYQAQGLGNAPEAEDLLVLEFKDTADAWTQVWDAQGYTLENYKFKRAMLPILDQEYLYNGFQFRFKNYASRAGSVDHWHIDYVELDGGRTAADTVRKDVSQLCQTSFLPELDLNRTATFSLLKEFSSMPWEHYKMDSVGFIGDTAFIALRNNDTTDIPTTFSLQMLDYTGALKYDVFTRTATVFANRICDNVITGSCNIGTSSNLLNNFDTLITSFPTDDEWKPDSTFYELRFTLEVADDHPENNVRVEKQEFYNYYAYDDGTAEAAYGLGELENIGMVAVKYNIKKEDTLQAIQIYLNPVQFDLSNQPVLLAVWVGSEQPGQLIWTSPESINLQYTDQFNYFYHYPLDTTLIVNENIWIGWIQQPATNLKFSVGFDKRTDVSSKVYYNLGTNWSQSSIPGAIMIRPSFGKPYDDWVGVKETSEQLYVKAYPNPTSGTLFLEESKSGQFSNAQISMFDLSGRVVFSQKGYARQLELGHLKTGTYILRVDAADGVFAQRIIIQE